MTLVASCTALPREGSDNAAPDDQTAPSYEVPVDDPQLKDAALYPVDRVHWRVRDTLAVLDYELPEGLVGRKISLHFEGPLANDGSARLSGDAGTAECTHTADRLECLETMPGLLPLAVDWARVEQIAAKEYSGPTRDRAKVAETFSGDPIGILRFDPEQSRSDDDP